MTGKKIFECHLDFSVITMRYTHVESPGNAAHFDDMEVDGKIILKFMSGKLFEKMRN